MVNQCHVVEQLSQAMPPGLCAGVSTGGVPCHYRPSLDGNDPLLFTMAVFFYFMCGFGVVLGDDHSRMGGKW